MKKILFFSLVALMAACSSDDTSLTSVESSSPVSVVQIVDGEVVGNTRSTTSKGDFALSFANEQALANFKNKIANMSDADAQQLINKMGVENLYDLENAADSELEAIGEEATSLEDFNSKYATYVEKYKGRLTRDSQDPENLSLVVPNTNNNFSANKETITFIANKNAEIVVANKVRKINVDSLNLKTSSRQIKTRIATYSNNDIYANGGSFTYPGKKIYYNLNYNYAGQLNFSMEAKKKMWYGWKADKHRNFYYVCDLTNIVYGGILPPMFMVYQTNKFINTLGFPIVKEQPISGQIYVWTDITSEKDANGNELTQVIGGVTYPLCKKESAYTIHVNVLQPSRQ